MDGDHGSLFMGLDGRINDLLVLEPIQEIGTDRRGHEPVGSCKLFPNVFRFEPDADRLPVKGVLEKPVKPDCSQA